MSDRELLEHSGRVRGYVLKNMVRLDLNQVFINDVYSVAYLNYEAAVLAWEDPDSRSHNITVVKIEARKVFEPLESQMEQILKSCPGVTKADLESINISTNTGGGRKPLDPPKESPLIKVNTAIRGFLYFMICNALTKRIGKPRGSKGAEVRIGIMGLGPDDHEWDAYRIIVIPTDPEQLPFRDFVSNGKLMREFKKHLAGVTVCIAGRWMNATGKHGPWSEILVVVVP
jgi:hypothetical protein